MKIFFLKFYKKIFIVLSFILLIYALVYVDLFLRAKNAYFEAEKYLSWYYNPNKKVEFFELEFKKEKEKLDNLLKINKISKEEYQLQLEILNFIKERKISESSLKYAYIWYKTAIELFSPPNSKYVKLAKKKLDFVKDMWKEELVKKGYKVEDYMLE